MSKAVEVGTIDALAAPAAGGGCVALWFAATLRRPTAELPGCDVCPGRTSGGVLRQAAGIRVQRPNAMENKAERSMGHTYQSLVQNSRLSSNPIVAGMGQRQDSVDLDD